MIHRGEVISDLKNRRSGIVRPFSSIYPKVKGGQNAIEKFVDEPKPMVNEIIKAVDIQSEHTKFLNEILTKHIRPKTSLDFRAGISNLMPSPRTLKATKGSLRIRKKPINLSKTEKPDLPV